MLNIYIKYNVNIHIKVICHKFILLLKEICAFEIWIILIMFLIYCLNYFMDDFFPKSRYCFLFSSIVKKIDLLIKRKLLKTSTILFLKINLLCIEQLYIFKSNKRKISFIHKIIVKLSHWSKSNLLRFSKS